MEQKTGARQRALGWTLMPGKENWIDAGVKTKRICAGQRNMSGGWKEPG